MNRTALCHASWAAALFLAAAPLTAVAQLTFQPYLYETRDGQRLQAEMGRLEVPENRANPSSGAIRLAVLRLVSTSASPGPPILYLAGGPGNSAIEAGRGERLAVFEALRAAGDVILLDQRGSGLSEPDLECRGMWSFPLDHPGNPDAILQEARRQARICAASLKEKGRDLAGFNAREIAQDVEDLRQALGVQQLNLLAFSWGTRLALTALHLHEERIARVILAGVVAPDHGLHQPQALDSWLKQMQGAINADPEARKRFPDFAGLLEKVHRRLRQPVVVEAPVPLAHRTAPLAIGEFDLQMYAVQLLGSARSAARLPRIYEALWQGDYSDLTDAVQRQRRGWLGSALPYAIKCSSISEASRRGFRYAQGSSPLGQALNFPFPGICQAWGLGSTAGEEESQQKSRPAFQTPALLISGTLDARTPLGNAQQAAKLFAHPTHLVIENAGHHDDLFLSSPRIVQAMLAFLRSEPLAFDRIEIPPPDFLN